VFRLRVLWAQVRSPLQLLLVFRCCGFCSDGKLRRNYPSVATMSVSAFKLGVDRQIDFKPEITSALGCLN